MPSFLRVIPHIDDEGNVYDYTEMIVFKDEDSIANFKMEVAKAKIIHQKKVNEEQEKVAEEKQHLLDEIKSLKDEYNALKKELEVQRNALSRLVNNLLEGENDD